MYLHKLFFHSFTPTPTSDGGSQGSDEEETGHQSEAEAAIMDHLKDLIQVVHNCLDQYQGMQSTEIKNAATELMSSFKS